MKRLSAKATRLRVSIWMNCVLLLCGLCLSYTAYSQSLNFEPVTYNLTTLQGLPSLETYSVREDSKGFLWIATDAGVCRYDGHSFQVFTTNDGLTDNVVFDTYEDFKGRIWFVTYNSMLCYYENEKIYKYKYNNKVREIVHELIPLKSIIIDSNENVYYSFKYLGMYKIDKYGEVIQLHKKPYSYFTKEIEGNLLLSLNMNNREAYLQLRRIDNKRILFNGNNPINRIERTNFYRQYTIPSSKYNLNNNYAHFENSIYDIKQNKFVFEHEDLISFKVIDSDFWICTLKGLIRASINSKGMLIEKERYFEDVQFSNITKVKGNYIMSTLNNGVIICQDFTNLKLNSSHGLIDGALLSITKMNNELIVSNSLEAQNIVTNKVTDFGIHRRTSKKVVSFKDRLLYFCSSPHFPIDKYSDQLKTNIKKIAYLFDYEIVGDDLYGVSNFIVKYNSKKNEVEYLYDSWEEDQSKRQLYLQAIAVLPDGRVYVGSIDGVFELKNKQLIPVKIGNHKLEVSTLDYNEKWGLIIGTNVGGIYTFKKNQLNRFDLNFGLLSNKINAVKLDGNSIYIGTSKGLNVLSWNGDEIENRVYSSSDFNEHLDVNSIYIDDKWIYLGANTGLVKLNKLIFFESKKKEIAKLLINTIQIDGIKDKRSENIDFPYSADLLKIDFSVFQYSNWTGKKYQYRVNATDQWIDIESPSISMFRPIGVLDIEVRYMNADFSWSTPQKLCKVRVDLPFWKRWYFLSIVVFFMFLTLFLLYERKQRRVQEKLVYDNQLLSLEQQMQNARMNPHFIFNVLNSINSYVLKEETEKANNYLMKFSKLMREILVSTKEGSISTQHEVSILNKYLELEQLRKVGEIEYEIHFNIEQVNFSIPSMMIQPFVENAVFYSSKIDSTQKSSIAVFFDAIDETCVQVRVVNSGIPSVENLKKMNLSTTKNAIGITKSRLNNYNKLHNTSVYGVEIKIIDNTYTSIVLTIPIVKL